MFIRDHNGLIRPDLEPSPMASRPILVVMGQSISLKSYVFLDPIGYMGWPKCFSAIMAMITCWYKLHSHIDPQ
jgi:hypothetical protein